MNFQTMNKQRLYILIAAAAGLISVFLPWISISAGAFGMSMSQGINGFHGMGIVVFLAFIAAAFTALIGDQTKALEKNNWVASMAAGAIALLFVIINMASSDNSMGGFGFVKAKFGWGIWLALAAAIGVIACSWLFKNPANSLQESLNNLKKDIPFRMFTGNPPSANNSQSSKNSLDELNKLVELKNQGNITEEEFQNLKAKIL